MRDDGGGRPVGATTVLLQGGLNPDIPWEFYPAIVRESRAALPAHHAALLLGARDPPDGRGLGARRCAACSTRCARPGRRRCPAAAPRSCRSACASASRRKKGGPETWLDVHREAHRVGMRSTATMMYGHVETDADIVEHLDSIRALQDETGGFTAFVPWSYKRGNTPMDARVPHIAGAVALPARAGGGAALPRQLRPRPGVVVRRGQEDRAGRRCTSGPTTSAARCSRSTCTWPPAT